MNHKLQKSAFPLIIATCFFMAPAVAQTYPIKPVTIVVAFPPGGDTDAIARLLAEQLSRRLKQAVIVENRAGAGGTLGYSYVARAPKDGYTLLFAPNSLPIAPFLFKTSSANKYDPLHDFAPIIQIGQQPLLLVGHPLTGFKSVTSMIEQAKSNPAANYASPGTGSPMQLIAEILNREAGVKITHVPYKGVGPAVNDVVAGHVQTAWITVGAVKQYLEQGRLVPLAIGDAQRSPLMPDVPTLVESGYENAVVSAWNGVFAPSGTPQEIIDMLNKHLNEIIKQPEIVERFATLGTLPAGGTSQALATINARDFQVLGKVIRDLGITAE